MKKLIINKGDFIGDKGIAYLRDGIPHIQKNGTKKRKCVFLCECGEEFYSLLSDVKQNKRTSCGCKKGSKPNVYKEGDIINGVMFLKTLGTFNYAQRAVFKCPICGREWESYVNNIQNKTSKTCCAIKNRWSKEKWCSLSEKSTLYKLLLYNESESFIKIGMTIKSVDDRAKNFPYDYKIIKIIEGDSSYIYDLEMRIKRLFKNYNYEPLIKFKGFSECFKL